MKMFNIVCIVILILVHFIINNYAVKRISIYLNQDNEICATGIIDRTAQKCGIWIYNYGNSKCVEYGEYINGLKEGRWCVFYNDSIPRVCSVYYCENDSIERIKYDYKPDGTLERIIFCEKDMNKLELEYENDSVFNWHQFVNVTEHFRSVPTKENDRIISLSVWTDYLFTFEYIVAMLMIVVNVVSLVIERRNVNN